MIALWGLAHIVAGMTFDNSFAPIHFVFGGFLIFMSFKS